jgi:hypothetical protein
MDIGSRENVLSILQTARDLSQAPLVGIHIDISEMRWRKTNDEIDENQAQKLMYCQWQTQSEKAFFMLEKKMTEESRRDYKEYWGKNAKGETSAIPKVRLSR